MSEVIHNLYLFIQDEDIIELGVEVYNKDGTDKEKLSFLRSRVAHDYKDSKRFNLPDKYSNDNSSKLPYKRFIAMQRQGIHLDLFEDLFRYFDSPQDPLVIITPIVDEKPNIDIVTNVNALQGDNIPKEMKPPGIEMEDYLEKYTTSEGFDLPSLLNDDYLQSLKLLFNHGFYVSCCKLLLSFIDTVAFLAYGDQNNIFKTWLNEYANVDSIGITSSELWELRNSLLHMTNLDSRKVIKGEVKRLMFFIGTLPDDIPMESEETKYFNLKELIDHIPSALENWIKHLNSSPNDRVALIERYDLIVSDVRKSIIKNVSHE